MRSLNKADLVAARQLLNQQRSAATARLASLQRDFDAIVGEAELTSTDDEHDPEGSTLAFERSQTIALLDSARFKLEEVDAAFGRIDAGTYGVCDICHEPMSADRLRVRPTATICVNCSSPKTSK